MSTKALEQVLETMPTFGQTDRYQTIDVYASGTTVLYTPPPGPQNYGNPIMPAGPIGNLNEPVFKDELFDQTPLEFEDPEIEPLGGNIGQIPSLPSSPINPVVIPYGNQTGLGGDVHDTFKIDRYDNPYGGHTSIKIPEIKPYQINWDK